MARTSCSMTNLFPQWWIARYAIVAAVALASHASQGQPSREFEQAVDLGGWSRGIALSVPAGNAPATGWPLIIGMHPAGTPARAMRDMMAPPARRIRAVVACPEGPDRDGKAIMPLVNWCKQNYKIDGTKIILTGYSAGGFPTFSVGLSNVAIFKGLIGIAPSVSPDGAGFPMQSVPAIPVALLAGAQDGSIVLMRVFYNTCRSRGGPVKLLEKPGVGHTGPYFYSPQFAEDWTACYRFCLEAKPKPQASPRP
jgi:poly(3-hydroxybutyrate) depolymerase